MGYAQQILPHYTYDDYVQWEGRWEVIEGIPYAMSPLPVPKHQSISLALASEFRSVLKKQPCTQNCEAYIPIDYKVSDDTILQPDVSIVCGEITKPYLDFAPVLVVEILSPSTALRDRHTKYDIYRHEGIKYYLIVDIQKESIEIHELAGKDYILKATLHNETFEFELNDTCKMNTDFSNIW